MTCYPPVIKGIEDGSLVGIAGAQGLEGATAVRIMGDMGQEGANKIGDMEVGDGATVEAA